MWFIKIFVLWYKWKWKLNSSYSFYHLAHKLFILLHQEMPDDKKIQEGLQWKSLCYSAIYTVYVLTKLKFSTITSEICLLTTHNYNPVCIPSTYFLKSDFNVIIVTKSNSLNVTLVNDQLDAQSSYFIIRLLRSSTCFELIIGRSDCINRTGVSLLSRERFLYI